MGRASENEPTTVDTHESTPSTQQPDRKLSLLDAVKLSPKIAGWSLALTSGILLYGYDLVIVGNVSSMPEFQQDYGRTLHGKLIIPSLWLGLWNIANTIGGVFGAIFAGFVQDRLGRRSAIVVASVISAVAVAVAFVSNRPNDIDSRRSIFFVAKVISGFAVNMIMCTTQTYMSEVLPTVLRGPILAFFPIFILIGQLVGSVVVYISLDKPGSEGYKQCFYSQWPFSALPLIVAAFLPESPTYLIRKNRHEEARMCQRRLASSRENPDAIFEQISLSIELEKQNPSGASSGYLDCFRGINRRRTMVVLFANLIPQLFGLTLLAKGSYFLQTVGMGATNSLLFLQVGIALGLIGNLVSMWTLGKFGRYPLILFGLIISTILWTSTGIAGIWSGDVTIWWTAVSLMLIITVCGFSTWPASYVVGAEASSLDLRGKSQGLGWLMSSLSNGIFGLVLPYIFNDDQGALRAKTGFVYTGFCILALLVSWWIVPEMKNRTPMEIDRMFELGIPARQFKNWIGDGEHVPVASHKLSEASV